MPEPKRKNFSRIIIFTMLSLGVVIVATSAFYSSTYLALLGVAINFWGVILLYVTPSKHVPLTLLNASAEATSANIERLISELNLSEKGVYLPPKNLKNTESSLIFIPKTSKTPLPQTKKLARSFTSLRPDGLFHVSSKRSWAFHSQKLISTKFKLNFQKYSSKAWNSRKKQKSKSKVTQSLWK